MMEAESTYIHALEGRLRIKVAGVKGTPAGASRVEAHLRSVDGILEVIANPMTGNVLVLYDPGTTHQDAIVGALRALGCLPYKSPGTERASEPQLLLRVARVVAQAATEAALQQALTALI
jgi:hypothetical protein